MSDLFCLFSSAMLMQISPHRRSHGTTSSSDDDDSETDEYSDDEDDDDDDDDDDDRDRGGKTPRPVNGTLVTAVTSASARDGKRFSEGNLTVTPIKILCKQNNKRSSTVDHALKIKKKLSTGRPRGRPPRNGFNGRPFGAAPNVGNQSSATPDNTPNVVCQSAIKSTVSTGSGRPRGRPPGSKKKPVVVEVSAPGGGGNDVQMTDKSSHLIDAKSADDSVERAALERTECSLEEQSSDNSRSYWQPPADPKVRRLIDRVSITDVTINAFTITVRESSTIDGFFKSNDSDGMQFSA